MTQNEKIAKLIGLKYVMCLNVIRMIKIPGYGYTVPFEPEKDIECMVLVEHALTKFGSVDITLYNACVIFRLEEFADLSKDRPPLVFETRIFYENHGGDRIKARQEAVCFVAESLYNQFQLDNKDLLIELACREMREKQALVKHEKYRAKHCLAGLEYKNTVESLVAQLTNDYPNS